MVFPLRGADGVFRPFLTRVMPVRDREGKVRWFGTNTDISEQRKIEEALRESELRLRTLTDNLPEGAVYRYRLDAHGEAHVDFISAGIERLTGVPASEFMADAATVYRNILPEDHERLTAAIAFSREQLEQFEVEVRHPHRITGETRWSLLRSTPTRNPDGSMIWDGIELDITERRRAEAKLAERTIQLEHAAAELAGAQSGSGAHEPDEDRVPVAHQPRTADAAERDCGLLRTAQRAVRRTPAAPLPAVCGQHPGGRPPSAGHGQRSAGYLPNRGRTHRSEPRIVPPGRSPGRGSLGIAPLASIKNISIENEIPGGMSIRADRTRFKQVLFNLVSNAVKFTPENGRVWIADASREDAAGFCVGDTGIGIPESELQSVFDEFHQVGGPANIAREGTGLGLAITRRLVELHGGAIGVESTVGQGSRFTFSLGPHSLEHPC